MTDTVGEFIDIPGVPQGNDNWDPLEHPRDYRGRFIKTGGRVQFGGGLQGTVTEIVPDRRSGISKVRVKTDDGREGLVNSDQILVLDADKNDVPAPNGGRSNAPQRPAPPVPERDDAPAARPSSSEPISAAEAGRERELVRDAGSNTLPSARTITDLDDDELEEDLRIAHRNSSTKTSTLDETSRRNMRGYLGALREEKNLRTIGNEGMSPEAADLKSRFDDSAAGVVVGAEGNPKLQTPEGVAAERKAIAELRSRRGLDPGQRNQLEMYDRVLMAKERKLEQERAAKELADSVDPEKQARLASAKTRDEWVAALRAMRTNGTPEERIQRAIPGVDLDLSRVHESNRESVADAVEDSMNVSPGLRSGVASIGSMSASDMRKKPRTLAQFYMGPQKRLEFGGRFAEPKQTFDMQSQGSVNSGWHVPRGEQDAAYATTVHELGHASHATLSRQGSKFGFATAHDQDSTGRSILESGRDAGGLPSARAGSDRALPAPYLKRELSVYGASNEYETIAESHSEFMSNGPEARPVAHSIGSELVRRQGGKPPARNTGGPESPDASVDPNQRTDGYAQRLAQMNDAELDAEYDSLARQKRNGTSRIQEGIIDSRMEKIRTEKNRRFNDPNSGGVGIGRTPTPTPEPAPPTPAPETPNAPERASIQVGDKIAVPGGRTGTVTKIKPDGLIVFKGDDTGKLHSVKPDRANRVGDDGSVVPVPPPGASPTPAPTPDPTPAPPEAPTTPTPGGTDSSTPNPVPVPNPETDVTTNRPLQAGDKIMVNGRTGTVTRVSPKGLVVYEGDDTGKLHSTQIGKVQRVDDPQSSPTPPPAPEPTPEVPTAPTPDPTPAPTPAGKSPYSGPGAMARAAESGRLQTDHLTGMSDTDLEAEKNVAARAMTPGIDPNIEDRLYDYRNAVIGEQRKRQRSGVDTGTPGGDTGPVRNPGTGKTRAVTTANIGADLELDGVPRSETTANKRVRGWANVKPGSEIKKNADGSFDVQYNSGIGVRGADAERDGRANAQREKIVDSLTRRGYDINVQRDETGRVRRITVQPGRVNVPENDGSRGTPTPGAPAPTPTPAPVPTPTPEATPATPGRSPYSNSRSLAAAAKSGKLPTDHIKDMDDRALGDERTKAGEALRTPGLGLRGGDRLFEYQDAIKAEQRRRENAPSAPTPAPTPGPENAPYVEKRSYNEELNDVNGEIREMEYPSSMETVEGLVRDFRRDDVEQQLREGDESYGVTIKVPSGSEVTISKDLARKLLGKPTVDKTRGDDTRSTPTAPSGGGIGATDTRTPGGGGSATPSAPDAGRVQAGDRITTRGITGTVRRVSPSGLVVYYDEAAQRERSAKIDKVEKLAGDGRANIPSATERGRAPDPSQAPEGSAPRTPDAPAGQVAPTIEGIGADYTQRANLTQDERDAAEQWTGRAATQLNQRVRNGQKLTSAQQKITDGLDSALAKYTLPTDVVTRRGIGGAHLPEQFSEGDTYTDPGYVSTSLGRGFDTSSAGRVGFEVTIPRGTHVMDTNSAIGDPDDEERELLLGRGTSFRIDSDTRDASGARTIRMTVLNS